MQVWTIAQLINFKVVPVEFRPVFGERAHVAFDPRYDLSCTRVARARHVGFVYLIGLLRCVFSFGCLLSFHSALTDGRGGNGDGPFRFYLFHIKPWRGWHP